MDEILSLQNQRRWRTGVPFPQNSAKRRPGEPAGLSPVFSCFFPNRGTRRAPPRAASVGR